MSPSQAALEAPDKKWVSNSSVQIQTPEVDSIRRPNRLADRAQRSTNFCAMQFVLKDPCCVANKVTFW